jgi:hypothetical protein
MPSLELLLWVIGGLAAIFGEFLKRRDKPAPLPTDACDCENIEKENIKLKAERDILVRLIMRLTANI